MTKHPEDYEKFYLDYGIFIKEGIITAEDNNEKVKKILKTLAKRYL